MPELGDLAQRAGELAVRIGVAAAVIIVFAVGARLTSPVVRRVLDRRRRPSYTRVFSGLYRVIVVLIGSLFALTLAFPSVRVADVLAIFGIVSVAAGFAFRDTFENLLAGVLLLLRDPFKSGDQVTIAEREGVIEGVTVRETLLRGYDGRRYFIPNAKVMTGVIEVETHHETLRQSLVLRFDPTTDIDVVRAAVTDAFAKADGVCRQPEPDVVLVDVVDGEVEVHCRFWTPSDRATATRARDAALDAVLGELLRRRIDLPIEEVRVRMRNESAKSADGRGQAQK